MKTDLDMFAANPVGAEDGGIPALLWIERSRPALPDRDRYAE